MEKEWVKVDYLIKITNLVAGKEVVDNTIKEWKEILEGNNINYKFDIEQETEYFNGFRGQYLNKISVLYLYTTKDEVQRMKEIINEYNNSKSEIPNELKQQEEDSDEETKPIKVAMFIFKILITLLIIFEISIMIIFKDSIKNNQIYIFMSIIIIGELYIIFGGNKKKRKNKDE